MTLDRTSVEFPNIMVSCGAKSPLVYGLLPKGPTERWMRPTFKRLEVKDLGNLEKLVADNIEGIEPGLRVVDSRLVLGQAAIDLVALDASESLVLIALGFMAYEGRRWASPRPRRPPGSPRPSGRPGPRRGPPQRGRRFTRGWSRSRHAWPSSSPRRPPPRQHRPPRRPPPRRCRSPWRCRPWR